MAGSHIRPQAGKKPEPDRQTHVNSPAFKYNLDLMQPVKGSMPAFAYEIKYQGQIYLWVDKQVDLLTFTDKGYEFAAKQNLDNALGQLVSSAKVSFDQASRKITFENLMTANAVGMPPNLVSVGLVIDSSDPRPAFRTKISIPKLAGRLPPMTLFVGEAVTLTIDVRPKAGPPPGAGGAAAHDFATAAAPRAHDFATVASPSRAAPAGTSSSGTSPQVASDAGGRAWWDRPSVLVPGAAILVMAVLATNVVTWGADAEVDPAAFAAAGGMWSRAFAH